MTVDYFYLCCNCGGIAPADDFEALQWHEPEDDPEPPDADGYRPSRPGETDPKLRCPLCKHVHIGDDWNPGLCDGTREQMQAERARLAADPLWADAWTEHEPAPADCIATPRRRYWALLLAGHSPRHAGELAARPGWTMDEARTLTARAGVSLATLYLPDPTTWELLAARLRGLRRRPRRRPKGRDRA